jgi:hypothetical protein
VTGSVTGNGGGGGKEVVFEGRGGGGVSSAPPEDVFITAVFAVDPKLDFVPDWM